MSDKNVLLILSVGGSSAPLVEAIKKWRPEKVLFVPSKDTEEQIEGFILPQVEKEGRVLSPGQYEIHAVSDPQDFAVCIDEMQRALTPEVERWTRRGNGYAVIVDFTGGTKCMSAALAGAARRWDCEFSYVGGKERDKGGVGTVVDGAMQVIPTSNPWDALGFQPIEEAVTLFNARQFAAAARLLDRTLPRVKDPARKEVLQAFKHFACGYDAWDHFQHGTALNTHFRECERRVNNLKAVFFSEEARRRVEEALRRAREHLSRLCEEGSKPGPLLILDLAANAKRRAEEGRYDDAVARLYRAIEAIAQRRLLETYGLRTSKVPAAEVPEETRRRLNARPNEKGNYTLGLQDAYRLLEGKGDPLGSRFQALGLHEQESALTQRNNSIWAHGFDPVTSEVYEKLWEACLKLGEMREEELPQLPQFSPV
jgi:CRISPR-associated protein (TIGR02710 family)